jgi:1-acyl-sn-glycerol-3-phosphate acyltransferase
MLPPAPVRRLLLVPLVVVIGVALAALTPPVALLSAAYNLVRRDRPGPVRRSRLLRVIILGLVWSAGETAALTVFLGLWLASGFGGRLDTEPYQARHYAVLAWFLDLVYRSAVRVGGLTVTVTGPPGPAGSPARPGDRPLIVLSRHAGPGDSLLLIHYLLSECHRRPRVVMKATLQLDPTADIAANRLPNAFLRRAAHGAAAASQRTEQIRRLAAGLAGGSALVIFPEGGNWTPYRWQRAIDRLRRGGRLDLAERAAAMPNVLPPHGSGTLAAIAACPGADVAFVAHTGLDQLVSVRDVWRSLHSDMTVVAHWWHVPADRVPAGSDRDAQLTWLYDWWQRIDEWITANRPPSAGPGDPAGPATLADPADPAGSPPAANPQQSQEPRLSRQ